MMESLVSLKKSAPGWGIFLVEIFFLQKSKKKQKKHHNPANSPILQNLEKNCDFCKNQQKKYCATTTLLSKKDNYVPLLTIQGMTRTNFTFHLTFVKKNWGKREIEGKLQKAAGNCGKLRTSIFPPTQIDPKNMSSKDTEKKQIFGENKNFAKPQNTPRKWKNMRNKRFWPKKAK